MLKDKYLILYIYNYELCCKLVISIYICLSINVIFFLLSPHHFLLSFSSPRASLSFPSFPLLSFPHSLPFLPLRLEWAKGWAYLCSAFFFLFFLSLSFFFLSSSIGPIDRPRWPSLISCLLVFENAYVLKIVFFVLILYHKVRVCLNMYMNYIFLMKIFHRGRFDGEFYGELLSKLSCCSRIFFKFVSKVTICEDFWRLGLHEDLFCT